MGLLPRKGNMRVTDETLDRYVWDLVDKMSLTELREFTAEELSARINQQNDFDPHGVEDAILDFYQAD